MAMSPQAPSFSCRGSDATDVDAFNTRLGEESQTQVQTAATDGLCDAATSAEERAGGEVDASWQREWDMLSARAGEKQTQLIESQCVVLREQLNLLAREIVAARQAQEREARERRAAEHAEAAERRAADEAVVQQLSSAVRRLETTFGNAYDSLREKVAAAVGKGDGGSFSQPCTPGSPKENAAPATPASGNSLGKGSPRAPASGGNRALGEERLSTSGLVERLDFSLDRLTKARSTALRHSFSLPEAATGMAIRCSQLEAALGDTRQMLSDDLERFRAELLEERRARVAADEKHEAACSRLSKDLAVESEQRFKACGKLDESVNYIGEIARNGVAGLHARMNELTPNASDGTYQETISAALRNELRLQEERITATAINALESRLDEIAVSLREELSRQEERLSSGTLLQSLGLRFEALELALREELQLQCRNDMGTGANQENSQNGAGHAVAVTSLSVRMTELAGMLREELRRQDALEAKLAELAGALHDELRRQEEVVLSEGISTLEGRLERLAELLREELRRQESTVIQAGLSALEAKITHLAADLREEHARDLSQLTDIVRNEATKQSAAHVDLKEILDTLASRLNKECGSWTAEVGELKETVSDLKTSVASWSDKEKDIWHALDTHTHDVAVDHRRAAAAAAQAAGGSGIAGGATPAGPASGAAAFSQTQRWMVASHAAATVSPGPEVWSNRLSTPSVQSANSASRLLQSTSTEARSSSSLQSSQTPAQAGSGMVAPAPPHCAAAPAASPAAPPANCSCRVRALSQSRSGQYMTSYAPASNAVSTRQQASAPSTPRVPTLAAAMGNLVSALPGPGTVTPQRKASPVRRRDDSVGSRSSIVVTPRPAAAPFEPRASVGGKCGGRGS